MTSRATILLFENSIKSDSTRKTYNYCLRRFVDYYKLKGIDLLLTMEIKSLQTMLEDSVLFKKNQ